MKALLKTVVLTVLVSFCAPVAIANANAADGAAGTTNSHSIANGKARSGATNRKKGPKRASKRDTKKRPEKVTSHEL